MTIEQRLNQVRATIARINEASKEGDRLTYTPRMLNDLSVDDFAELLRLLPDASATRSFGQYSLFHAIDGIYVRASTKKLAELEAPDVRRELNAMVN